MAPLFPGHSRHIEFIGATVDLRRAMVEHMFDPSSIVAFRLLIVLTQAGGAALIVTTIIVIRRWLVAPVAQRLRGKAMFGPRRRD